MSKNLEDGHVSKVANHEKSSNGRQLVELLIESASRLLCYNDYRGCDSILVRS